MTIQKRGDKYWFRFVWNGELIRKSTRQSNARVAAQIEDAYRTQLAKGEVGIHDRKCIPTLEEFATGDFLPYVRATFAEKPKTREYYERGIKHLLASPLGREPLDKITSDKISTYAASRREAGAQLCTVNRELECLRRAFRLANEWGKVDKVLPSVRKLPGERRRDRVLSADEERRYLKHASGVLKDMAILLLDCGLRPEEIVRLRWDEVRGDAIHIAYGKTESARRVVPLSKRAMAVLKALRSDSEWVFPAGTKSGHVEPSSLRKRHYRTCLKAKVARFVFYDLRHSCLTRWAAHLDAFTLAYLAGHRDISTTKRYVHPQPATVRKALERARAG